MTGTNATPIDLLGRMIVFRAAEDIDLLDATLTPMAVGAMLRVRILHFNGEEETTLASTELPIASAQTLRTLIHVLTDLTFRRETLPMLPDSWGRPLADLTVVSSEGAANA